MKFDSPYLLFRKKNILFWLCFLPLFLLSLVYGIVVTALKFLYKIRVLPSYKPGCRIISVGNITLGGTGKTPLVEWIVKFLRENHKDPGIIIRGYKRPKSNKSASEARRRGYLELGDEAVMLSENLGNIHIAVGRDKIKSAQELEDLKCDTLILDDGFQHWRLRRDLDIVAIDCSQPLFAQRLLPLGRLREPLSSLKRAQVFILTKADLREDTTHLREYLHKINPKATVASSIYNPVCFHDLKTDECFPADLPSFKGMPVFIVSGIANPIYFDKILSNLKLNIKRELVYPDHYEYKRGDLDFIKKLSSEMRTSTVITTHKDAVRLRHFLNYIENVDIFYLEIELKVTKGEEELRHRILSVSNS
jgi:tetraacyldisaccharide 4'-kinase